ncbi:hypothetical protein [Microbacterium sp. Root53]|uniref:hypothetical protein n=1 Tax=Microbacterium sp. Root53 TaxID=1736553 RepID=UPI0012E3B77E|nr:hypothetical protein [Microbacterium sp. Root53]
MNPIAARSTRTRIRSRAQALALAGALAGLVLSLLAPLPALAAANLVKNGSFESFGATAPTDWGTWTPAGTATCTKVAGRDGSGAVQIETATTGSRGFLVQDVALPAGAESIDLSFWQDKGAMTGAGKAGVRVTFTGSPAQFFGLDAASGWHEVATRLKVPAGATNVRIEPMVDYMKGAMRLDDVDIEINGAFTDLAGQQRRVDHDRHHDEPSRAHAGHHAARGRRHVRGRLRVQDRRDQRRRQGRLPVRRARRIQGDVLLRDERAHQQLGAHARRVRRAGRLHEDPRACLQ